MLPEKNRENTPDKRIDKDFLTAEEIILITSKWDYTKITRLCTARKKNHYPEESYRMRKNKKTFITKVRLGLMYKIYKELLN